MTYKLSMELLLKKQALLSNIKFGNRNKHIHDLQTILFEMGYANELNWEKFGADGDFGNSTTKAVQAFAKKNDVVSKGKSISLNLAKAILKRYNILDDLQHLSEAIKEDLLGERYSQEMNDKTGNAVLRTLLASLGYGKELKKNEAGQDDYSDELVAALADFGEKEDIPTDGKSVSKKLAQQILDRLSIYYGSSLLLLKTRKVINTSLLIQTILEGTKIRVNVSDGEKQKQFTRLKKGLYTFGDQNLKDFLAANNEQLKEQGVTNSAINVIRSVAENEGNLDAVNTWDNSFLSFGIFQWTLGPGNDRGELPALLKKIRNEAPDAFFDYFSQYGLDVSRFTNDRTGYLSLGSKDIKTIRQKEPFRSPEWAFRFWQAGQDSRVMAVQVKHALDRLKRFYWKKNIQGRSLADLMSSEYGVALLLDNHVNRPGYVAKCVREALRNSGLDVSGNWTTSKERRLTEEYLRVREGFGKQPMTDAFKRANVTRKYLEQGLVSDKKGSFVFGD